MGRIFVSVLALFCILSSSAAFAENQLELPFPKNEVETLRQAFPGDWNTKIARIADLSFEALLTLQDVDLVYEMGDRYHSVLMSALYKVMDSNGKTIGFMEAALLNYTEGSEVYLVAAKVDLKGVRVDRELTIATFEGVNDPRIKEDLPEELWP